MKDFHQLINPTSRTRRCRKLVPCPAMTNLSLQFNHPTTNRTLGHGTSSWPRRWPRKNDNEMVSSSRVHCRFMRRCLCDFLLGDEFLADLGASRNTWTNQWSYSEDGFPLCNPPELDERGRKREWNICLDRSRNESAYDFDLGTVGSCRRYPDCVGATTGQQAGALNEGHRARRVIRESSEWPSWVSSTFDKKWINLWSFSNCEKCDNIFPS